MPKFNDSERNFVTFTTTLHKTMEHLKFCDKAPHQFYARLTNCRLQGTGTEMTCVEQSNAQWAKSGFFVQWVYWVYLFSQNTLPLFNAAMQEQV